jgi:hypothetical protein
VLATYHIRPLNQAFKSTFTCLSQLADSPEEEYNRNAFICSISEGEIDTLHGILTFIKRLTGLCLQSLHHRFIDWTKSDNSPSLMVRVLTDFARSKSELVAENALLRQQLIILRRQVKRPACTKTDRTFLVLLARMVRTWKQAHITRSARRRSCGGIARDFSCIGSTSPEQVLLNRRSLERLWP